MARGRHTDWEKRLCHMIWRTRERALNRKLTTITKGHRGVLDRIQIPTYMWFLSTAPHELFHYDNGVFEAFSHSHSKFFHAHHTVKMPPANMELAVVTPLPQGWHLTSLSPIPDDLWRDITSQAEIESTLIAQNQRHLKQVQRQGGQSMTTPITTLRADHGFNNFSAAILEGSTPLEYDLTPEMSSFFSTLKRLPTKQALPTKLGTVSSVELQTMFSRTRESTSYEKCRVDN